MARQRKTAEETLESPDVAEAATNGQTLEEAVAEQTHAMGYAAAPAAEVPQNGNGHAAAPQQAIEPTQNGNGHAAAVERKPLPVVHGSWRDNEVGVRREEDFKNKLTTIVFRDKPPAKAQALLVGNGYQREGDRAFSKPVDFIRRREHREAADNLVLDVDNIIREEKGLPKRESFYISRS